MESERKYLHFILVLGDVADSEERHCDTEPCSVQGRQLFTIHVYSYIILLFSGLLISGAFPSESASTTVEAFVPSTGQHCQLPDLPGGRYKHSMENRTVCVGGSDIDSLTACLTLTDEGTWEKTITLLEKR